MERKTYHLVYQCGIANVVNTTDPTGPKRVLQGSYRQCEDFCRGLVEGGAWISVMHCDVAGDILTAYGFENLHTGPGTLWSESKNTPRVHASFAA